MRDIEKPHQLENVLRETQRRRLTQRILKTTSRALIVSSMIAVGILLANRMFGSSVSTWWSIVTISAGLPIGIALGARNRFSKIDAASALDDAFELKNRLATAVDLHDGRPSGLMNRVQPTTNAFAELVGVDAESTAGKIKPARVFPLRWDSSLTWAVLCCASFAIGMVWLPDMSNSIFPNHADENLSASTVKARSAAEAIQDAAAELQMRETEFYAPESDGGTTADGPDDDTQEVLNTLENLRNQLTRSSDNEEVQDSSTSPQIDSDQRVAEAADALDMFAKDLGYAAEVDRKMSESILERFSGLRDESKKNETEPNGLDEDLRKFVEALKNGDAQRAAEEIAAADRKLRDQSPSERKQAADALRKLADQIEQKPAPGDETANEKSDQSRRTNDQTSEPNSNEPNEERDVIESTHPDDKIDASSSTGDESPDPETAQQLEEYERKQKIKSESEKEADEHLRDVAEQIRKWADDLRENKPPDGAPSKPDENERSQQDSNNSAADPNTSKEQSTKENAQGAEQTQSSNERNPAESAKEKSGAQHQTKPSDQVNSQDNRQGEENNKGERTKPSSDKQGEQGSKSSKPTSATDKKQNEDEQVKKVESTGAENEQTGSASERKSEKTKRVLKPGSKDDPNAEERKIAEDSTSSTDSKDKEMIERASDKDAGQNNNQTAPKPDQSADREPSQKPKDESSAPSDSARRLQDILKKIDSVRKRAGKRQKISEEARRQARRLIEHMTPEERKELDRWASKNLSQDQQQPEPKTEGDAAGNDGGSPLGGNNSRSGNARDSRPFDYQIENLDARLDSESSATENPDDDRVLSEWPRDDSKLNDENGQPKFSHNTRTSRSLSPAEIANATRALERALQEEAIAPRYRELLKRWSRQLSQQLKSESDKSERTEQSAESTDSSPVDSK